MIKIRIGYELLYDFPQPTPLIIVLGTHFSRASDIVVPDDLPTTPCVTIAPYRDAFGNWCGRYCGTGGQGAAFAATMPTWRSPSAVA